MWIYLLEKVRNGDNKIIWIFPITMLFWANVHGGFLAGVGLVIIYALGEFFNKKGGLKYLGILALILPVTLINPYGFNYWEYLYNAITMPRPYITEWQPLNLFTSFTSFFGFKILLLLAIIGFGCKFFLKNKKIDFVEIILLLTTLYLGIKHQRHIIFFAISASVFTYHIFYEGINNLFSKYIEQFKKLFTDKNLHLISVTKDMFIFTFLLLIAIYCSMSLKLSINVDNLNYPTTAVEFIKENNLKGNLLLPFNWGSYALWKLHPNCLVSIDGRYEEAYDNNLYLNIANFTFHYKGWNRVLNKYRNDIILIQTHTATYDEICKNKKWKIVYSDKYATVFLPASFKKDHFKLPDKNIDYSKTKFLNNINV